jgi:hypothetical protein
MRPPAAPPTSNGISFVYSDSESPRLPLNNTIAARSRRDKLYVANLVTALPPSD